MSTRIEDVGDLYATEQRRLERRAARRVGAAHAADVVQDVFVALWTRARGHVGNPSAYLTRAIDYAAISHVRAERRRASLPQRITEEQYAAPAVLPDQVVAARQDTALLARTIAALPERTRHVFLLNRMHDCSYDEIAAGLGLSYSTVEREIARALLACRNALR
ncbi:RNA polymerase sigma factor [Bosea sp. BH3]|uniref:RNA polymerase sigma factor n=1 Tax=Bosea sp. BH3 TaxID=2871701 RepID=UPI0021CB48AF|nr:sigma-70 family RNA polymerase sigma factor [Bosea sp. BH3]MCU4178238.1 sigma-70 family RNA polymerase sigma factor [Bosea sp. BH3]